MRMPQSFQWVHPVVTLITPVPQTPSSSAEVPPPAPSPPAAAAAAAAAEMGAVPLKWLVLLVITLQTTALVLVMRYSRANASGPPYFASTAVLLTEAAKFSVVLLTLWMENGEMIPASSNLVPPPDLVGMCNAGADPGGGALGRRPPLGRKDPRRRRGFPRLKGRKKSLKSLKIIKKS